VHDATEAAKRDFDVAIQRLRHTRGVPDDASSIMWRTGKAGKALNVLTMMGGVVPSSVSDVARPIWRYGVMRTLKDGWLPYISRFSEGAKEYRMAASEINSQIGLNIEPTMHGRAQALFDLGDDAIARTRLERGLQVGANKMGVIALYDYWTAGMKSLSGNVVHATMIEYVPKVAEAVRAGVEPTGPVLAMRTYLRKMGLRDLDIHRIALQMEKPDGVEVFSNGGRLPNINNWDDVAAFQAYQAAVIKEVDELIVTPGLERPNWVDENMGYSLVAQFQSFTFGATSRMAMSALQGNDPYLMQGIAFSLAFGAASYYLYAVSSGGKTYETAMQMDPEKWIWEAVKRSGILGVGSYVGGTMESIPALTGEEPSIFTRSSGLLGTFLGPTFGQLDKLSGAITQMGTDNEAQQARNLRSLRQIFVPFQNHFLFRQLFDRVGDAIIGG
jgi:hypothetical protein